MLRFSCRFVALSLTCILLLTACGGGGGGGGGGGESGGGAATSQSTLTGSASIDGAAVAGGTVRAYYYDTSGSLIEVASAVEPVTTDTVGGYEFTFDVADLSGISAPLVLVLEPEAAAEAASVMQIAADTSPATLKTLLPDLTELQSDGGTASVSFNLLTTITAEYLASYLETQPVGTSVDATVMNNVVTTVNNALAVTWNDATDSATYEAEVLPNLAGDASLLDDFARLLADDLTDGALDGRDLDGSLLSSSDYGLDTILPEGLRDFHTIAFVTDDTAIGSDGSDSTALIVTITDGTGQAVSGEVVTFAVSTGGYLDSTEIVTDAAGEATVHLTSDTPGSVSVTCFHSLPSGSTLSDGLEISVSDCSAVTGMTLTTDKETIYDDGFDSALVTAAVTAACSGSTVPDGTEVFFSVTDGGGTLFPTTALTVDGQATTELSSQAAGSFTVSGEVDGFTDSLAVNVIGHPCDPAAISLGSDPGSIIVGTGIATITAMLSPADAGNCPEGVTDGTVIAFDVIAGIGTLSGAVATTTAGVATVDLESDTVNTVTVQGTTGDLAGTVDTQIVADPCAPGTVTVASDPSTLTTLERSTITATVEPADSLGCPGGVLDGTPVAFSVEGTGSLDFNQQTTTNGIASVTYTPDAAGEETVSAEVNGQSDTATLTVLDQPATATVSVFIPAGTSFAGLDVTLDYDESTLGNGAAATTATTNGFFVDTHDDGDTVTAALVNTSEVEATSTDAVVEFTFDVAVGLPVAEDFIVLSAVYSDQDGFETVIDPPDVTLEVSNE